MTAAEILRNAEPPADDGLIDKAIAELDVRIWEWADALKSAHTQLRSAFAVKAQRPSARLFDDAPAPSSLAAAAAAAHIPSTPPMPSEWTAPVASSPAAAPGMPAEAPWASTHGGHGMSAGAPTPSAATSWGEPSTFRQPESTTRATEGGVMSWPTSSSTPSWPSGSSTASTGAQEWPTWTPTDTSATPAATKKGGGPQAQHSSQQPMGRGKSQKAKPLPEGPSPEERAQKAAAEEALLAELEDAISRRVRLLRRLDPDTPIEKLIDKAKQGQAEAASAPQAREDKSSSWWRRK